MRFKKCRHTLLTLTESEIDPHGNFPIVQPVSGQRMQKGVRGHRQLPIILLLLNCPDHDASSQESF